MEVFPDASIAINNTMHKTVRHQTSKTVITYQLEEKKKIEVLPTWDYTRKVSVSCFCALYISLTDVDQEWQQHKQTTYLSCLDVLSICRYVPCHSKISHLRYQATSNQNISTSQVSMNALCIEKERKIVTTTIGNCSAFI